MSSYTFLSFPPKNLKKLFYECECLTACISVHCICTCEGLKKALDSPEVKLQTVVSHDGNAGNQTWVLWQSSECSWLLSLLSSPCAFFFLISLFLLFLFLFLFPLILYPCICYTQVSPEAFVQFYIIKLAILYMSLFDNYFFFFNLLAKMTYGFFPPQS